MKGKIKFYDETKGFGFITADDGKEYFVHQTGLKPGVKLNENDAVTFDVVDGDRGPKAENVTLDTADSGDAEVSEEEPEETEDVEDTAGSEDTTKAE